MKLKRFFRLIFLHLQGLPMPSIKWRPRVAKMGGVNIVCPKKTFIGANVWFDTNCPEEIVIEMNVTLTVGCKIFSHYPLFDGETRHYIRGHVRIKENAWIGANTIICQPVTIGRNAVVGAGSIVTKDIPDNQIWAGNPAKFIKMRKGFEKNNRE